MKRTARQMAGLLKELYGECFGDDENEPYRLAWSDLRMLAGVSKITDEFIASINEVLAESDFALIPFNDFLIVASEADFRRRRNLPGRMLEKHLCEDKEEIGDDGDEDDEV